MKVTFNNRCLHVIHTFLIFSLENLFMSIFNRFSENSPRKSVILKSTRMSHLYFRIYIYIFLCLCNETRWNAALILLKYRHHDLLHFSLKILLTKP